MVIIYLPIFSLMPQLQRLPSLFQNSEIFLNNFAFSFRRNFLLPGRCNYYFKENFFSSSSPSFILPSVDHYVIKVLPASTSVLLCSYHPTTPPFQKTFKLKQELFLQHKLCLVNDQVSAPFSGLWCNLNEYIFFSFSFLIRKFSPVYNSLGRKLFLFYFFPF